MLHNCWSSHGTFLLTSQENAPFPVNSAGIPQKGTLGYSNSTTNICKVNEIFLFGSEVLLKSSRSIKKAGMCVYHLCNSSVIIIWRVVLTGCQAGLTTGSKR